MSEFEYVYFLNSEFHDRVAINHQYHIHNDLPLLQSHFFWDTLYLIYFSSLIFFLQRFKFTYEIILKYTNFLHFLVQTYMVLQSCNADKKYTKVKYRKVEKGKNNGRKEQESQESRKDKREFL